MVMGRSHGLWLGMQLQQAAMMHGYSLYCSYSEWSYGMVTVSCYGVWLQVVMVHSFGTKLSANSNTRFMWLMSMCLVDDFLIPIDNLVNNALKTPSTPLTNRLYTTTFKVFYYTY